MFGPSNRLYVKKRELSSLSPPPPPPPPPPGEGLTSTLNGCSSPFTAHKIHSSHCKHSVPTQQLPGHLLLRTAGKNMLSPRGGRFSSPVTFIHRSVLKTKQQQTKKKGNGADKSYAASSDIAGVSLLLLAAPRGGEEEGREEGRGEDRRRRTEEERRRGGGKRGEASGSSSASRRCFVCLFSVGGRRPPGEKSRLSTPVPVLRSPGRSSGAPAVVPSGRVQPVFRSARHSCPFSVVFSHRARMRALLPAPPAAPRPHKTGGFVWRRSFQFKCRCFICQCITSYLFMQTDTK